MFKPVSSKVDFPAMEHEVMDLWEERDILAKYLRRNEGADKRYSFIDGPITANNPMGVHHAWGRMYKDLFLRYKTMQGFEQRYQNGFDGQGLWIEVEVEKELGFKSKRDIEAFGIDKFVELCKQRVRNFSDIITRQSLRLGQWMDWDNSYHTMSDENNYTIWLFLKKCFDRGWLYEGRDVMPWCPRCGTGLSEHEIVTEGYQEVVHPGLFVRFPLLDRPGESLLVWTTTPWTLTSNVAAAVHPELVYVKARLEGEVLYVAKGRLAELKGDHEILEEMPGSKLEGLRYRGPFDELPAQEGVEHRVVEWDEVSESEGTGIVHTAPGAGKEDFALGKEQGLATIAPLDEFGDFIDGFDWLTGRNVYDVNEAIYDSLREKGVLYRLESYTHRYPVCWRCDSELVFRLVDEWFISMDELRDNIAAVTSKIRWVPSSGLQRELDWLKNMDDGMISKKRYWGLALPIYKCECGNFEVMGSEDELEARAVEGWDEFSGHSPHRPWIDAVKIGCSSCGAKVSRIRDVGNPWLDAGIVSFSTLGYRHDKDHWRKWFPADWISESFPGQFRNWFYSLLTMAAAMENSEPCRAVFSYALMRDDKGEEMHKSKGNAIWFEDGAGRMGVDAMRWLFARQNPAANMNFGYGAADEVRRRFLIPLWNVYSFLVTYANIDRYDPATTPPELSSRPELDRWIIAELNGLVAEVTDALDNFDPDRAASEVEHFVEYLSNWYVRRSRRRFWKSGILGNGGSEQDEDKLSAYATLYECMTALARLLAPFTPFVAEALYQNLVRSTGAGAESVHLDFYPVSDASKVDRRLSGVVRLAMRLSSLGRAARNKAGLKVRQPLAEAVVSVPTQAEREYIQELTPQLLDELNVKSVREASQVEGVIRFEIRPNLPILGPKYGPKLAEINRALAAADATDIALDVESGRHINLGAFTLLPDEVLVTQIPMEGYSASSEGGYTVAVATEVSPELAQEGLAREMVHRVQNMRRTAGFDIADHIVTYHEGGPEIEAMMATHGEYVQQETLSDQAINRKPPSEAYTEMHDLNGTEVELGVRRVS
ncbi:MAG: isoleucine--tRNA ligase [SAR202 cluster bacterium]|nr:isoleucine--tRNA ligase [SAR202 cluster bacterium]